MVTQTEVEAAEWTVTDYGGSRHEYIVHRNYPELCEQFSKEIAEHGVMEVYKGRKYPYFYFNGYKYWRIRDVINRAKVQLAPFHIHLCSNEEFCQQGCRLTLP